MAKQKVEFEIEVPEGRVIAEKTVSDVSNGEIVCSVILEGSGYREPKQSDWGEEVEVRYSPDHGWLANRIYLGCYDDTHYAIDEDGDSLGWKFCRIKVPEYRYLTRKDFGDGSVFGEALLNDEWVPVECVGMDLERELFACTNDNRKFFVANGVRVEV